MSHEDFSNSLTVRQVSKALDVSERSVREFINSGELKASKVGQWRISRRSLSEFIDARSNQFVDRARQKIRRFLSHTSSPENGVRTMVVRDYASTKLVDLSRVEATISSIPDGSGFEWMYIRKELSGFDRHILCGTITDIVRIIDQLDSVYTISPHDPDNGRGDTT